MSTNHRRVLWGVATLAVLALLGIGNSTQAQIDPVGPLAVASGTPVDLYFLNEIPPGGQIKVFDFLGEALNQTSTTLLLEVAYDYVDAAGNTVLINPGGNVIAIPPGGPWPVDPGPYTLNFCPQEVSLHFQLRDIGEILLQGQYGHICLVPEPSGAISALVGLSLLALRRRLGPC